MMNTIKIGWQEWATEDLKVTKFRNGEDIPLVKDNDEWCHTESAAYCITPDGHYLYNWYAVNDPRGLAPEGFRVPTDEEWAELTDYLSEDEEAGEAMKTPGWNGDNSSGFTALPAGYRANYDGSFNVECDYGFWWSSSNFGTYTAWFRSLHSDLDYVYRDRSSYRNGFSVRCIVSSYNT